MRQAVRFESNAPPFTALLPFPRPGFLALTASTIALALKGNQRDYATINQLICISNMENINSVMINDGVPQPQRLKKLNEIAIQQMRILTEVEGRKYLK